MPGQVVPTSAVVIGALATTLGIGLLLPAGVGAACLLRIRGRAAFALAGFLACASMVVGESIVLSFGHLFTRTGLLVSQTVILGAVGAGWLRAGRPRAPSLRRPGERYMDALKNRRPLGLLLMVAMAAVALQSFMAVVVAPNEADTVGYHLPRVVHWLQHHTVFWSSHDLNDPEVSYPPNAELLAAWTAVLSGTSGW